MPRSDEIRQDLEQTQEDLERTANEVGDRIEDMAASVEDKVRPPARTTQRVARAAKAVAGWIRTPIVLATAATAVAVLTLRALRQRNANG